MAGSGERFKEITNLPKYKLKIRGKSMFEWAMLSLSSFFDEYFIFISLKKDSSKKFIEKNCKKIGISKFSIIELESLTRGQAETAFRAEPYLEKDDEIIIYNIDTYVKKGKIKKCQIKGDGWIPYFNSPGEHWSFVKHDSGFRVYKISEKLKISNHASIGLYYFKNFKIFKEAYLNYYRKTKLKEHYVAPIYSVLIDKEKKIYSTKLKKEYVYVLGTPQEVKKFEKKY